MDGIYFYGIVDFPPPLPGQIRGFGGGPVFLVPHEDLAAVVSRSPLSPWPVDEAHLTLHETVVEEVMGGRPILPVRFNTFLKTKEAVIALLDKRAQAFRSALERVRGRVEMGLRVLWEPPREAGASVERQTWAGGPGTEYLYRRIQEERRRAGLLAAGERLIQEVQELFHSLAVESWLQRFPTDCQLVRFCNGFELSTAVDNSMCNSQLFAGAYLVEQDRMDAFREVVAKAVEKFSRLSFLLTGPWPPHSFVNLRIGPEGLQDEGQSPG